MIRIAGRLLPLLTLLGALAAPAILPPDDWSPPRPFSPIALHGAGDAPWAVTFGSERTDWVNRLIRLRDGSFVAVGFVDRDDHGGAAEWDGFAHAFDERGEPIWTVRLGGPGLDAVWGVAEMADGRLALGGFSAAGERAGDTDLWLRILAPDGSTLLERWYGGPAEELGFDILATADGGLLLIGQTRSFGAGERDVFLVRTDADGEELWRRTIGGSGVDRGFYGVQTPDGGFVIAGVTGDAGGGYDTLALKVDGGGEELWRQVVGGPANDPNHGVNLLPDGRVLVAGYTAGEEGTVHDLFAFTLAADGEILTHEVLVAPGDERLRHSLTAPDGATWLVGSTSSFGAGSTDALVARVGADGRFAPWLGAVGTAGEDVGTSLWDAGSGTLVLGGYTATEAAAPDLLLGAFTLGSLERHSDGVRVRRVR